MMPTIVETLLSNQLCLSQSKNGTDKEFPKKYISQVYDPILGPHINSSLVFLEIGVRTGASVYLWAKFFSNIQFIGIDSGRDVVWQNENWLKARNVTYLQADGYIDETFNRLPGQIDVIIDDGPHTLSSQKWAAKNYSKILAPEGYLFIEDIQGGLRYCDRIIRSLPAEFKGCVRVFDLRKVSGEGDALIVLIHNCTKPCSLGKIKKNEMSIRGKILRLVRVATLKYHFSRSLVKMKFKITRHSPVNRKRQ